MAGILGGERVSTRRIAQILTLAGAALFFHQLLWWGRIDWDQVLHHEFFAGTLMCLGVGIIIGQANPSD